MKLRRSKHSGTLGYAVDRRGQEMTSIVRPVRYPALDGLRAYAAFLVFMVHFCGTITVERFRWPIPFSERQKWIMYLADGHHGVDMFFLLSVFLIGRMVLTGKTFNYLS